jgi:DNA mismatch repair protein MutL
MDKIKLLSDAIANQIAAGEVVQRPASVVKELLENSIDAGGSSITLIVKESGKTLIQVIDNGSGMSPTDARMCFERHATSKIRESIDLFNIRTMGFRGEAMASIAAVAQVELRSKRDVDELGTLIRIEGSEVKEQEFVQAPKGTSIAVKNLFFNVPARRKFLKSNPVEMKHIIEEFQRVALAHPEVQFALFHNEIEILNLPSAKLSKRIVDTLDKSYRDQLAKCEIETDLVKITGYIGKPQSAKRTKGDQYFFVNKRFIKSSYLNHAVISAFESAIPQGSFPFYSLFLEINPENIDINIHPTKTEIKFDNEQAIYAILRTAVKQAIAVYNLTPSIDFDADINIGHFELPTINPYQETSRPVARSGGNLYKDSELNNKDNLQNWEKMFESFSSSINTETEPQQQVLFASKANREEDFTEEANTIQIHNTYILTQVKSGLMIIHQRYAYERVFYEKYLKDINSSNVNSQQLLFPKTVSLSALDYALSGDIIDMIRSIGFNIEEFGNNTYLINGVPAQFMDEDEAVLFKGIIESYKENENHREVSKKEALARTLAKKYATRMQKDLNKAEMTALINQLFETSMPSISPEGKPVMTILSLDKVSELIFNNGKTN